MTRTAYDRYCDPKLRGSFIAPELGGMNLELQSYLKGLNTRADEYYVEFTGTYPLTEVQILLREHGLRDYPEDVSLLRKLPKGHIKSDVIRFWYNIELHYRLPYPQLISKQELWRRAFDEGATFANWLDDLFSYSYRNTYGSDFIAPDEFDGIQLEYYSSVFPPCFLPRIEEETSDMRKWMSEAPIYNERIRREILHEVEKIVRACNRLYIPHFEDIIASIKDTVCYYDGVKYKPHELQLHQHCEIRSDYVGYESKILVYPSGMRDTVILEKGSSNMIRICEKIFLSIIDSCEESIYGINGDRLQESLNFFSERESGYHVLRDIKKCGLTVPISIYINDIQDILYKYFPDGPWNALDIYKNIKIKLTDGIWLEPKRGAGLGMANNLTTLLCIAAHRLAKRYFYKYKPHEIYITGRIGNDDSDVYVDGSIDDARDYLLYERDILSDAGFVVNIKKTYISKYYHLFEEYQHENFRYKESLAIGMLVRALLEKNLRTAKYMAIEAQKLAPTRRIYEIIEAIALNRPYEFDSNELNRPFWLGGWVYKRLDGNYLGLDSLATALLYSRKEVYRAGRIIQDFHRMVTSMKEHQILAPYDNANYVWRRAGFVGEAPKGRRGFYNYSLSENYRHMTNMWKIKNQPQTKIKILRKLYSKDYTSQYSKLEFITFCVKSCNFYNDISYKSSYITLYETEQRHYQIPLKVPFKSSEAAYVSKELAGMLEALPKCLSELSYAKEYYPIFQYDSIITNIDPQGKRNYLRPESLISAGEKIIEPFDVIDMCTKVEEILGQYNIILYPTRKEWLFQRYVSNAYAYLMKDGIKQDDALLIEREEFSNYWSFLDSMSSETESTDTDEVKEKFWHILEGGDENDFIGRIRTPVEHSDFYHEHTDTERSCSVDEDLPVPSRSALWFEESTESCVTRISTHDYETESSIREDSYLTNYSERSSSRTYSEENLSDKTNTYSSDTCLIMSHIPTSWDVMTDESERNDSIEFVVKTEVGSTIEYSSLYDEEEIRSEITEEKTSSVISYVTKEIVEETVSLRSESSYQSLNDLDSCRRLEDASETEYISIYDRDRDPDMCIPIVESSINTSDVWVQLIRRKNRFFLLSERKKKEEAKKYAHDPNMCVPIVESTLDTEDVWVQLIRRKYRFFLMSDNRRRRILLEDARRIDEEYGLYAASEEIILPEIFQDDGESYPHVDDRHLRWCIDDFDSFKRNRRSERIKEFATNVQELWYERNYGRKDNYPVDSNLLAKAREKLLELKLIDLSEDVSDMSFDMPWRSETSSTSC